MVGCHLTTLYYRGKRRGSNPATFAPRHHRPIRSTLSANWRPSSHSDEKITNTCYCAALILPYEVRRQLLSPPFCLEEVIGIELSLPSIRNRPRIPTIAECFPEEVPQFLRLFRIVAKARRRGRIAKELPMKGRTPNTLIAYMEDGPQSLAALFRLSSSNPGVPDRAFRSS